MKKRERESVSWASTGRQRRSDLLPVPTHFLRETLCEGGIQVVERVGCRALCRAKSIPVTRGPAVQRHTRHTPESTSITREIVREIGSSELGNGMLRRSLYSIYESGRTPINTVRARALPFSHDDRRPPAQPGTHSYRATLQRSSGDRLSVCTRLHSRHLTPSHRLFASLPPMPPGRSNSSFAKSTPDQLVKCRVPCNMVEALGRNSVDGTTSTTSR